MNSVDVHPEKSTRKVSFPDEYKSKEESTQCNTIEESDQCKTKEEEEEEEEVVCGLRKSFAGCSCGDESHHPKPSKWFTACQKCLAQNPSKKRPSEVWNLDGLFDPYRTFEVKHENCYDLTVTVHRGEGITKGSKFKDSWDIPDPYILLRIPEIKLNTPKRTITEDDTTNPIWNQTFHFYIYKNPVKPYVMEINLMDENVLIDESIDTELFPLDSLEEGIPKDHCFTFKGNSKVFITFLKKTNETTDLRFSMSLCDDEKHYLFERRKKVLEAMKSLLGDDCPEHEKEVPVIGILGSGGGFRAMIGLCGALRALQDTEIFDCSTYLAGLSGSTWCISTLYSDTWNVEQFQETLRKSVGNKWEWNILKMPQYVGAMLQKYWKGQSMSPVTLVDIFGHLIGDVLLGKEKKDKRLSDLRDRIEEGDAPFPLFAGLHATERSSEEFSEWIEFSPYEIGMGKYGTFMQTDQFGSKFLAGKLMKKYKELPLHYLQALWGSAFTVNLKRHLMGATSSASEDIADEFANQDSGEEDNEADIDSDDSEDECEDASGKMCQMKLKAHSIDTGKRLISSGWSSLVSWNSLWSWRSWSGSWSSWETWAPWLSWTSWSSWITSWTATRKTALPGQKSQNWFVSALETVGINGSYLLNLRAVKPGRINNPFRGLDLKYAFIKDRNAKEIDTTDHAKDKFDHGCKFQPLDQDAKRMSVMDSGFAFNSPYPLLLRPQRGVDIFLSFDFSHRTEDLIVDNSAFKHLVKAEEWARKRHIPFPPVKEKIDEYLGTELQECYVFESSDDHFVPVILHFPLVNNKFRQNKTPESPEEEDFSDFPCFGENSTFSTFKFNYEYKEFDRLAKLMEFNTLLHKDTIIETIKKSIINKKKGTQLGMNEIAKILLWHKRNENED